MANAIPSVILQLKTDLVALKRKEAISQYISDTYRDVPPNRNGVSLRNLPSKYLQDAHVLRLANVTDCNNWTEICNHIIDWATRLLAYRGTTHRALWIVARLITPPGAIILDSYVQEIARKYDDFSASTTSIAACALFIAEKIDSEAASMFVSLWCMLQTCNIYSDKLYAECFLLEHAVLATLFSCDAISYIQPNVPQWIDAILDSYTTGKATATVIKLAYTLADDLITHHPYLYTTHSTIVVALGCAHIACRRMLYDDLSRWRATLVEFCSEEACVSSCIQEIETLKLHFLERLEHVEDTLEGISIQQNLI